MYVLSVTPEEIQIIGAALDELPFKQVSGLVENLRKQLASQQPNPNANTMPMGVVDNRANDDPLGEAAAA